jgi:hypothetical protein
MSIDIHFLFCLKTSRDTLNLKLNVKWKLYNIHIDHHSPIEHVFQWFNCPVGNPHVGTFFLYSKVTTCVISLVNQSYLISHAYCAHTWEHSPQIKGGTHTPIKVMPWFSLYTDVNGSMFFHTRFPLSVQRLSSYLYYKLKGTKLDALHASFLPIL